MPISTVTAASLIEAAKIGSDVPFNVLIEFDELDVDGNFVVTHKYINDSIALADYAPAQFNVSLNVETGALSEATLTVNDFSRAIVQLEEAHPKGPIGWPVRVLITRGDETTPDVQFDYEIQASSSADYQVSWQLGVDNPLQKTVPVRRVYSSRCSHTDFKNSDCRYSGPDNSCTFTEADCAAKGNIVNFGGFPGMSF